MQTNQQIFEPSVQDIRDEMRRASLTFADARESLIQGMKSSAHRLATAIPTAPDKIKAAQLAADEAIRHADAIKESHEFALHQAETMLRELGETTLKIRAINELVLTPEEKFQTAHELIGMHVQNSARLNPAGELSLQNCSHYFLFRFIVQDQLPAALKPLEEQSKKLVAEIKSLVRREKINLAGLIQILSQEQDSQGKFSSYAAADSFSALFES
jgi:hypothetical protein